MTRAIISTAGSGSSSPTLSACCSPSWSSPPASIEGPMSRSAVQRPVAVTYEAGPTGFGLARFLTGEGIDCQVAAPSKLQRPRGDRVKTDCAMPAIWPACCTWARSSRRGAQHGAGSGAGPGARPGGRALGSDVGPASAVEVVAAPGDRLLRRQALDRCARAVAAPNAVRRCSPCPGWRWPTTAYDFCGICRSVSLSDW
jgi:hypothetical protein